MSTSVFKPIRPQNFELPRIRATIVNRGMRSMEKVRRVLFEPVDHVETEKFLQRELAQHTLKECNKWEFDFQKELPFYPNNNNNSKGRYSWKPITPSRINLAPKKRQYEEEYDNSDLYLTLPEKSDALELDDERSEKPNTDLLMRQSKITDFMQSRKRAADLAFVKKTSSSSPIPNKRATHTS